MELMVMRGLALLLLGGVAIAVAALNEKAREIAFIRQEVGSYKKIIEASAEENEKRGDMAEAAYDRRVVGEIAFILDNIIK